MRGAHDFDLILARIQLVAGVVVFVGVVVIVACEVVALERDRHVRVFARFEQRGLGEAHQSDVGLFDLVCVVRRGHVDLYDVLAGVLGAGVLDVDGHGEGHVVLRRPGQRRAVLEGHILDGPLERGVAQAVAEGEHDVVVVPRLVARAAGLVVAVADVDALLVVYVVFHLADGHGAVAEHVRVAVVHQIVGEVLISGILGEVALIGVDGLARGVDRTFQYAAERVDARVAGAAYPQAGVDLARNAVHALFKGGVVVVRAVQEAQLHGGGGVDDHDDLLEVVAGFDEHVLLVLVQFEVMVVRVHRAVHLVAVAVVHRTGQVEGLAAYAREHDDRGVAVFVIAALYRVGVAGDRGLARGEAGYRAAAVVHRGGAFSARAGRRAVVEFAHRGIDHEARVFQTVVKGGRFVRHGESARTGTAVSEVDGVLTEHRHSRALGEGQSVGFVLEQREAFFGYLFVDQVGFFESVVLVFVIGYVVITAEVFHRTGAEHVTDDGKEHEFGEQPDYDEEHYHRDGYDEPYPRSRIFENRLKEIHRSLLFGYWPEDAAAPAGAASLPPFLSLSDH